MQRTKTRIIEKEGKIMTSEKEKRVLERNENGANG